MILTSPAQAFDPQAGEIVPVDLFCRNDHQGRVEAADLRTMIIAGDWQQIVSWLKDTSLRCASFQVLGFKPSTAIIGPKFYPAFTLATGEKMQGRHAIFQSTHDPIIVFVKTKILGRPS